MKLRHSDPAQWLDPVADHYNFMTISVLGVLEEAIAKPWECSQLIATKRTGGEGGIRTLGTGVSPYNGLAIISADVMRSNLNHLQSCSSTKTPLM
jgi:hypothetical protein